MARKLNGLHHINLSARIDFILFLLFFHSIFKHLNRYCWLNCFRRPTLKNALRESSTWFGKSNSFCTKAKKSHTHRKYSRTAKCGRIKFYRYNRPHNNRFGVVKFSNLILKLDLIRFDSIRMHFTAFHSSLLSFCLVTTHAWTFILFCSKTVQLLFGLFEFFSFFSVQLFI